MNCSLSVHTVGGSQRCVFLDEAACGQGKDRFGAIVRLVLLASASYVLLAGPAAGFGARANNRAWRAWCEEFYTPLAWIAESTFAQRPLDWWLAVWGGLRPYR